MKTLLLSAVALLLMQVNLIADAIPAARRIAWDPGVRGGISSPSTMFCNVTNSIPGTNIVAVGDGTTDDWIALQTAINLCPTNQYVLAPDAVGWRLTNSLYLTNNGVTLRAASTNTPFIAASNMFDLFVVGSNPSPVGSNTWTAGFTKGTNSLTLGSTNGIILGQIVVVTTTNNVANGQDPATWPSVAVGNTNNVGSFRTHTGYGNGRFSLGHLARVTNMTSTTIEIDPPLPLDYTNGNNHVFRLGGYITERIGLENIHAKNVATNIGATNAFFSFYQAANSWASNTLSVASEGAHARFTKSLWCSWIDSYFNSAENWTANAGYGLELYLYSTACLIQNNIFERCLNAVQLVTASQNVIAYNFTTNNVGANDQRRMSFDLASNHGAHPAMNLFEGNKADKTYADFIHGTASHQVFLRNWLRGWGTNNASASASLTNFQYAVAGSTMEYGSRYYSFIGNVLGWTNKDTSVAWRSTTYQVTNPATSLEFQVPVNWIVGRHNATLTSSTLWDSESYLTLIRSNNIVAQSTDTSWTTHTNEWNPASITNSYYLTSKPPWWGTWAWPAIGPDLTNALNVIPAEARRMLLTAPSDAPVAPAMPPTDLDTTPINRIPALQFQQTPNGLKQPATRRFIIPSQS